MVGSGRLDAPSLSRGRQVASALARSWRSPEPPPWEPRRVELAALQPLLIGSGTAALAWRRLRLGGTGRSPGGFALQQAYRLHAIESLLRERQLARVLARLRAVGVEPLLARGWVAAQAYPEPGLRPYRDFELFVAVAQREAAREALRGEEAPVTLAVGCADLNDRPWQLLADRAVAVPLGGADVRVFGAEDHVRLLALQMLRRGAYRALWLCDVAAAIEAAGTRFDWSHFLSGDGRRSEWATGALLLACALLGAEIPAAPPAVAQRSAPQWLVRTVLREWSVARPGSTAAAGARGPRAALRALRERWPSGLEATLGLRAPLNAMPRLPLQVAACVTRAARELRPAAAAAPRAG
jgi:hypothetical protein